jgi:hypothetical protein
MHLRIGLFTLSNCQLRWFLSLKKRWLLMSCAMLWMMIWSWALKVSGHLFDNDIKFSTHLITRCGVVERAMSNFLVARMDHSSFCSILNLRGYKIEKSRNKVHASIKSCGSRDRCEAFRCVAWAFGPCIQAVPHHTTSNKCRCMIFFVLKIKLWYKQRQATSSCICNCLRRMMLRIEGGLWDGYGKRLLALENLCYLRSSKGHQIIVQTFKYWLERRCRPICASSLHPTCM